MSTTPLEVLQFELGDVIFGADTDVWLSRVEGLGNTALRTLEYPNPQEDGRSFGREWREGRDLIFEGGVRKPGNDVAAWDLSGDLEEAFDAEEIRMDPRAVMPLRLRRPGKPTRTVFGRPDKYDPDITKAVIGWIPWSGTFRCADRKYYADTENVVVLSLSTTSSGYITTDEDGFLTDPITTVGSGRRLSIIENAGDADTWPVIEIAGPITNPSVSLLGPEGTRWYLEMVGELAYDQVAVIDTRPWSRGAALDSGSALPGALSRRSAPSLSKLPPGSWEIVIAGLDVSGTSSFTIRWRDAYKKL